MGTITTHAWGFRNLIGLTWDSHGQMFAAENGYDIRGSRPVKDYLDASLHIHEGMWYGVPDSLQAGIFIDGEFIGKDLGFVIDHEASGLTPPDPSVVRDAMNLTHRPVC
jgi:glucose/arabinose dehydrogenase